MSYFHGWMYLSQPDGSTIEVFNPARTAAYISGIKLPNGSNLCDVAQDWDCPAYAWEPPCCGEIDWTALTFVDPATDNAPWYNPAFPESADALGFIVDDWTGLDSGHITRQTTPRAYYGSTLGRLSAGERVMKLNVICIARSEQAMEYLFRWLENLLAGSCTGCATDMVMIRRWCPDVDLPETDLFEGVVQMNQVGVVEGLTWESDIALTGRNYLRLLSFTIAAGDPCMYSTTTGVAVDPSDVADLNDCVAAMSVQIDRDPCRFTCSELIPDCRAFVTFDVGEAPYAQAPTVTLTNDATTWSMPLRVICYADPLEVDNPRSPCGLRIVGELYVRPLPPSSTIIWDVVWRTVLFKDHTTGGFVPGWAYTSPNDPPARRWFSMGCGMHHIVIEPATACLEDLGGGLWTDGEVVFEDLHFPTMSLALGGRMGCA